MLFGIQFWINYHVQLAFLSVIFFRFEFIGLSFLKFLFITFAAFLSDLAVSVYPTQLLELINVHKQGASAKLRENS